MTDSAHTLRIVIPGEMRGKGRPRFSAAGGRPRAYTDSRTASMEAWVRACAVEAGATCTDRPIWLRMRIAVAVPQSWSQKKRQAALNGDLRPTGKPDLDNCLKLVADALNGIAWRDDRQIIGVTCHKHYAAEPLTVLEVWPA